MPCLWWPFVVVVAEVEEDVKWASKTSGSRSPLSGANCARNRNGNDDDNDVDLFVQTLSSRCNHIKFNYTQCGKKPINYYHLVKTEEGDLGLRRCLERKDSRSLPKRKSAIGFLSSCFSEIVYSLQFNMVIYCPLAAVFWFIVITDHWIIQPTNRFNWQVLNFYPIYVTKL